MKESEQAFEEEPVSMSELATIRWRLVRSLRHYQLIKHVEVLDPFIRAADGRKAASAARMKTRCIELGDRFQAHVTRWSGCDIATDLARYKLDALGLTSELRGHLAVELREMTSLLL